MALKDYIQKRRLRKIKNKYYRIFKKKMRAHQRTMAKIKAEGERLIREKERAENEEKFREEIRKIERRQNRRESDYWGPKFFGPL